MYLLGRCKGSASREIQGGVRSPVGRSFTRLVPTNALVWGAWGRVCRGSGDGEARTAFARSRIGGSGESGAEFAGGEGVEGTEARGELTSSKAALATEQAEEV